jgi:ABC-type transport system involved in cytochrome c biogenesis permease subunit
MSTADGPAIWPRAYWHTWEALAGPTYATALTRLRAWSNTATILLFIFAFVMLVYFLAVAKTGSMLPAILALLVPWGVVSFVIEYRRSRVAQTMARNLAANGRAVPVIPPLTELQFLGWKREHGITADDLQNSAPLIG